MKVLSLVSLCTALVALAFSASGFVSAPPPPPAATPASDPNVAELALLTRRVELLEDDQRRLWDRVVALEKSLATPAPPPQPLEAQVQAAQAAAETRREELADVLQDPARREAINLRLQRGPNRGAELAQRWKDFPLQANLNADQQLRLDERLKLEDALRARAWEEGAGRPSAQRIQELGLLRRETDQLMQSTLSAEQFQQYQQLRNERGRW